MKIQKCSKRNKHQQIKQLQQFSTLSSYQKGPSPIFSPRIDKQISSYDTERSRTKSGFSVIEHNELKSYYDNIQKILKEQNSNLKNQNAFLTAQIQKFFKKQKNLKNNVKNLERECEIITGYYQQLIHLKREINKYIQSMVFELASTLQMKTIDQIASQISRIIDNASEYFSINASFVLNKQEGKTEGSNKKWYEFSEKYDEISRQQNQKNPLSTVGDSFQTQLSNLNEQFQSLMIEYRKTNNIQIKKACMEIAKQIKTMKSNSQIDSHVHQFVTFQRNQVEKKVMSSEQKKYRSSNDYRRFYPSLTNIATSKETLSNKEQYYNTNKSNNNKIINRLGNHVRG